MAPLPKPDAPVNVLMMEKHYIVLELATEWGFSYDFVLKHFRDEPGVVVAGQRRGRKRGDWPQSPEGLEFRFMP